MELDLSPGEKIQIIRNDDEHNYKGRIVEVLPNGVLVELSKVNAEYVDFAISETVNVVYNIMIPCIVLSHKSLRARKNQYL